MLRERLGDYLMLFKKRRIIKIGNDSYGFSVPKAYIKDGNLVLGEFYDLEVLDTIPPPISPLDHKIIEDKTIGIIEKITKDANKNSA